ncbi:MAG: hypothetical protein ABL908_02795 [Hyphomicrobium sp.]
MNAQPAPGVVDARVGGPAAIIEVALREDVQSIRAGNDIEHAIRLKAAGRHACVWADHRRQFGFD